MQLFSLVLTPSWPQALGEYEEDWVGETKALLRMGAMALMLGSSFFWIKFGLQAFSSV